MTEFLCPYKGCGETKKSRNGIKKHLESCFYQKLAEGNSTVGIL